MSIRRRALSITTLTGGDLSVDILHTEDSVTLGDGTDTMTLQDVGGVKSIPTKVLSTVGATDATLTGGSQRSKITDGTDNVEIDDVGGEKALKVSVIASVGGGGGGTAATDSAAFTAGASQGTPMMGARDDTSSDTLAEGEMGIVRMTTDRAIHTAVQNTVAVSGTFWQATQPISASSLPLPTGAATEATLGSILTAAQLIDDMIATTGAAVPTKASFVAGTDGTNARALKTDSSGELQIDVLSIAAGDNNIGNVDVVTLPALPAGTNNIGDVDVLTLPSLPAGTNNIGDVDVLTLPSLPTGSNTIGAVTQSGTWNVGTLTTITNAVTVAQSTSSSLKTEPNGNVAHGSGDSGNPIKIGGKAHNAFTTLEANGDRVDAMFDLRGRLITIPNGPRENSNITSTTITSSASETTIVAAGGAGIFRELISLVITNSSATGITCTLRDGTGGTIKGIFYVPATGGIVICPSQPYIMQTANNTWTLQCSSGVASIYVAAQWISVV